MLARLCLHAGPTLVSICADPLMFLAVTFLGHLSRGSLAFWTVVPLFGARVRHGVSRIVTEWSVKSNSKTRGYTQT